MNRAVPARALVLLLAGVAMLPAARPAHAQYLAPALDRAGFEARLRQPSLRLASMGRLYLAVDDENERLNLWDYAASSTGMLADRDSTSLDIFFETRHRDDQRTLGSTLEQADHAQLWNIGLQAIGRVPGRFAAGVDGGYLSFDSGLPAQRGVYEERTITAPVAMPTINGLVLDGRLSWAAHAVLGRESLDQRLRLMTESGGELKLKGGDVVGYPSPFTPNEATNPVGGLGFGVAWNDPDHLWQFAANADWIKTTVRESNSTQRRVFETEEVRPMRQLAGSLILTPLPWVTFGGQAGESWYDGEQTYRFSISGGSGGIPTIGRGDRLAHSFRQDFARARVMVRPPAVERLTLGADFNSRYDRHRYDPATGTGDFNAFLVTLQADTLVLPGFVLTEAQELRHWDAGLGAGYRVSPALLASAEIHRYNNAWDGLATRVRQRITDLRAGVEYELNPTWMLRLGGWHRADDRDVYTAGNERMENALTGGVGLTRAGGRNHIDLGFEYMKRQTDFPDPTAQDGSGFRLMGYSRWAF
jgi:hypothetical protein